MKFLKLLKGVLPFFALAFGGVGAFMVTFALTALTVQVPSNVLATCVTSCGLADIQSSSACNVRGGVSCIYWGRCSEMDLDVMSTAANFDPATQCLLGYVMTTSNVMYKLTFDRKNAFYDFTYTEADDVYTLLVTVILEGKSKETRNALCNAIACCDLVLHILDNNCIERVIGIEWDGTSLVKTVSQVKIGRHLDSSGQLGDSKPRDEVDFTGEALCPPLFATVGAANIPV